MVKNEWRAIAKNKFLWLVMLALVLIPSLYNVIFLSSMWDPYGNVKNLPVAVVNNDQKTRLNGKTLALGEALVSKMKTSESMDYHFVSSSDAEKGLSEGKYYMIVTFPKDLSQNAASLMDTTPKKATIDYQTSKGHNYISAKMSDTAMNSLQSAVSQDITKDYTHSIFDNLSNLKSDMSQAASASQQLSNGSGQAASGSETLSDNLSKLSASTLTFSDGAKSLDVALAQYTNGLSVVSSGVQQLGSGSNQLIEGTRKLSDGLSQLTAQTSLSDTEESQLTSLKNGLIALNSAIQSGSANSDQLTNELTTLAAAAQTILNAQQSQVSAIEATDAYQSLPASSQQEILAALQSNDSTQATQQILLAVQSLQVTLTAMQAQQTQLQAGAAQVLPAASDSLSALTGGLSTTHSALNDQLLPGIHTLLSNQEALQAGLSKVSDGTQQLLTYGPALTAGAQQLTTGSQQLANASNQITTGSATLTTSLGQLHAGLDSLSSPLVTASKNLEATPTTSVQAQALASPVALTHTDSDSVATNGVGMAPYMLSVALFVGALATNVMFGRAVSDDKKAKNGRDFLLGKLAVNGPIAALQGLLVTLAVYLIGLRASHPILLILGAILTAFTFMMIVSFFNLWLGKVGAFLMLLLLLLQLATAAGTYPIQLEASIFQTLNPWLPMTYTVLFFRQAISLTGNVGLYFLLLLAIALVFTALIPLVYKRKPLIA